MVRMVLTADGADGPATANVSAGRADRRTPLLWRYQNGGSWRVARSSFPDGLELPRPDDQRRWQGTAG